MVYRIPIRFLSAKGRRGGGQHDRQQHPANRRGLLWYDKRNNDRAIADYDQAIRLKPDYALAYYNRGLAKRAKGDTAGGDADVALAKQIQRDVGK